MQIKEVSRVDYDSAWKQGIEGLFKPFIVFCHPNISRQIDWNQPIRDLDKELHKDYPKQKVGKHISDKLFEATRKTEKSKLLYIHLEIQCQRDENFGKRMFWYNTQIMRKVGQPVVSIALLADSDSRWKPTEHLFEELGCCVKIKFHSTKLLEYSDKYSEEELKQLSNPFSGLLLTYLAKEKVKNDPEAVLKKKIELTKLYEHKSWSSDELKAVMRFLQWILVLPWDYELKYREAIRQESKAMQLHFLEEEGIAKGLQQGLQEGREEGREEGLEAGRHDGHAQLLGHLLERRFNIKLTDEIRAKLKTGSLQDLEHWADQVLTAKSLNEVFGQS